MLRHHELFSLTSLFQLDTIAQTSAKNSREHQRHDFITMGHASSLHEASAHSSTIHIHMGQTARLLVYKQSSIPEILNHDSPFVHPVY